MKRLRHAKLKCPGCGKSVILRVDGKIGGHNQQGGEQLACPYSGKRGPNSLDFPRGSLPIPEKIAQLEEHKRVLQLEIIKVNAALAMLAELQLAS